jgi:hypothetical protein
MYLFPARLFDYTLIWHMYDILSRKGILLYGNAPLSLRLSYVAQLEAAGHLNSALYIILVGAHGHLDVTKSILLEFLTRNWPKAVCLPPSWLDARFNGVFQTRSKFDLVEFGLTELSEASRQAPVANLFSNKERAIVDFLVLWTDQADVSDIIDPMNLVYTAKVLEDHSSWL